MPFNNFGYKNTTFSLYVRKISGIFPSVLSPLTLDLYPLPFSPFNLFKGAGSRRERCTRHPDGDRRTNRQPSTPS